MKKKLLYLIVFFSIISCQEDIKFNNPAFEGRKDNVFWRAVDVKATLVNGSLTIDAYTQNEKLTLITNSINPGTYILGTTNQANFASYISSTSTINPPTYQTIVASGPINKVLISSAGTAYTNGLAIATTGGSGSGLKVNIVVTASGSVIEVSIASFGMSYTSGDIITVLGGNGDAKLIVQNVENSNGEIVITDFDAVKNTVSGTYKFNAINVNNDPLVVPNLNFQHGIFYRIPLK